jgi:predicted DCC family thiol-disulfide oxidoreductase YuxK
MLTIFYDGMCPLCLTEMNNLKRNDNNYLITLVDIHCDEFKNLYTTIKYNDAMKILHGIYDNELLLGLQVIHRTWTLVGKGFWVAPLHWPLIKNFSHWVYLGIAKYRHPISRCLANIFRLSNTHCTSRTCYDKSANINHRGK